MVRNILIGLAVLVALVVGGAYLLPGVAHVERSTVMAASPEEVFSVVNDMSRFNEWSPWAKLDPNTKYTMEGSPTGVGAKMSWSSANENVGTGTQEIIESTPFSHVKTKLDFGGQVATATFTFAPGEGGTKVTWAFDSELGMNPVARYFGLMFDGMIGKDYEAGLANLKALVEKNAQASTTDSLAQPGNGATPPAIPMAAAADPTKGPEVVTVEAKPIILTRATAKAADNAAISAALGAANQKILNYGMANELSIGGGAPLAITISHSADGDWVFDAAMPLAEKPAKDVAEADGVKVGATYAGRAVKLTHKGPYNTMADTYARIHAYTAANKLTEKPVAWEEYVGDPTETEDAELLTNVYVAVE